MLPPLETLEALRARAAKMTGPMYVELELLRDRPDLPTAAAELLGTGNERERIVALLALREAASRGSEVADPATLALRDASPGVRKVAARTLGAIGWAGAAVALEAATHDRDADVCTQALLGLLEVDAGAGIRRMDVMLDTDGGGEGGAVQAVLGALEDAKLDQLPAGVGALTRHPDPAIRRRAMAIFGYSASTTIAPLQRGLVDPDASVKLAALAALMRRQQRPSAEAVASLVSDPDARVVQLALRLIVLARGPQHPDSLEQIASDAPAEVAEAIAVLGGAAAIPKLLAMLSGPRPEPDLVATWRAVRLVGEVAPWQAGSAFLDSLRSAVCDGSDRVRHAAVMAASTLGLDAARAVIARLVDEPAPRVRAEAMQTLAKLLGTAAAPHLRHALADDSELVRCAAVTALGQVGTGADRAAIEQMAPPTPMEALVREQALLQLGGMDASSFAEVVRVLADPGGHGRFFTRWSTPIADLRVVFSGRGIMLVYRDDEVEIGRCTAADGGGVRIAHQVVGVRMERIRIHELVTSAWGYRLELTPDPWSQRPRCILQSIDEPRAPD
ncbi:MAG TPA: HEAT repeat domain-containing protein [Kofleriaceae bacterium]|jgi:HEAT repeat protein|nr:HEAT repeat domain-containing protein [Kofleriaceae bacterium]